MGDEKPKAIRQEIYKEQQRGSALRREWHRKELRQRRSRERVYFIQCEAFVKIGTTRNASKRISEFQVASPMRVHLAGVIPGDATVESKLHKRWHAYHVRGEWFLMCKSIREFIDSFAGTEDEWREHRPSAELETS